MTTYKLIRSLSHIDVFNIITDGNCDKHLEEIKQEIIDIKGEWFLNNWNKECKLDILSIYLSDSGFMIYTNKQEAERLEKIFKSWDIFNRVGTDSFRGKTYTVGFSYDYEAFQILYNKWVRNNKINQLIETQY